VQLHRFYCEDITEPVTELLGGQARHLSRVLRLKENTTVELFDGKGSLAKAVIKIADKKRIVLEIKGLEQTSQASESKIVVAVSIAKGERFDWMIAKCTELGVDGIYPVIFERTVKQSRNPKAMDRWRNIIISAAQQSGRLFLPEIARPSPLTEVLANLKRQFVRGKFIFGSLSEKAIPITGEEFAGDGIVAFVGPEGGLTEAEEILLKNEGAQPIRLTENTLRVETAAVAFTTILAAQRHRQSIME